MSTMNAILKSPITTINMRACLAPGGVTWGWINNNYPPAKRHHEPHLARGSHHRARSSRVYSLARLLSPIIVPISEADLPSLLARIEARDQQAFDQLYRHYSPMVQSYLRTKTRDPNLIEDVVSRTLFEVWQYPTRYQPDRGAKFSTWLIQIAIHKLQERDR